MSSLRNISYSSNFHASGRYAWNKSPISSTAVRSSASSESHAMGGSANTPVRYRLSTLSRSSSRNAAFSSCLIRLCVCNFIFCFLLRRLFRGLWTVASPEGLGSASSSAAACPASRLAASGSAIFDSGSGSSEDSASFTDSGSGSSRDSNMSSASISSLSALNVCCSRHFICELVRSSMSSGPKNSASALSTCLAIAFENSQNCSKERSSFLKNFIARNTMPLRRLLGSMADSEPSSRSCMHATCLELQMHRNTARAPPGLCKRRASFFNSMGQVSDM